MSIYSLHSINSAVVPSQLWAYDYHIEKVVSKNSSDTVNNSVSSFAKDSQREFSTKFFRVTHSVGWDRFRSQRTFDENNTMKCFFNGAMNYVRFNVLMQRFFGDFQTVNRFHTHNPGMTQDDIVSTIQGRPLLFRVVDDIRFWVVVSPDDKNGAAAEVRMDEQEEEIKGVQW